MRISGHRTISMFNRYDITSSEDKRAALQQTQTYVAALPKTRTVEPIRAAGNENNGQKADKKGRGLAAVGG
jgi:hypothetical protein